MSYSVDPRATQLVSEFGQLTPADQELVLALVHRLGSEGATNEGAEYPPDVVFMDFEE
jgi:hypothetical protein